MIYVKRLSEFVAKMVLKKHQRALVTSFKRNQVDDLSYLDDDKPEHEQLLQSTNPTIQDAETDFLAAYVTAEYLTED